MGPLNPAHIGDCPEAPSGLDREGDLQLKVGPTHDDFTGLLTGCVHRDQELLYALGGL